MSVDSMETVVSEKGPSSSASGPWRTDAAIEQASPGLLLVIGLILPCLLVYGLMTSNELRIVAIVVAALLLAAIVARPFWGLLLFIGLVFIRPEETIPALAGMRLPLIVSVATLLSMWIHMSLRREPLVKTPLNGMMAGFALAVVLSTMPKGNPLYTTEAFIDMVKLSLLVVLIVNLTKTPSDVSKLVTLVILASAYLAFMAIRQYNEGIVTYTGEEVRAIGAGVAYSDPNDLAMMISAGLVLAVHYIIKGRNLEKIFYGSISGLIVYAILLTNSRGGMLCLLTAIVGGLTLFLPKKQVSLPFAGFLIVLVLIALSGSRGTSFSLEGSSIERFSLWIDGLASLKTNPVTGIGYSQFAPIHGRAPHNTFIQCLVETGLLGYFFWIGCLCVAFRDPHRGAVKHALDRKEQLSESSLAYASYRLALAVYLMGAFFLTHAFDPILYIYITIPVAVGMMEDRQTDKVSLTKNFVKFDTRNIVLAVLGSIAFIKLFTMLIWRLG